jgi:hypothetical protein
LPLPYPFCILSFLRWNSELRTSSSFRLSFVLRCYRYLWLHGVERNDNWSVIDWRGIERKWPWPKWGTIPPFAWKDRRKPRKTSIRETELPTEIRTQHLPNISPERYHCARDTTCSCLTFTWHIHLCKQQVETVTE